MSYALSSAVLALLALPSAPQQASAVAPATAGHARMLELLRDIRERTDEENEFQGQVKVRELTERLAALRPEAAPEHRYALLMELGDARIYHGEERAGLAMMEQAHAMPPDGIPLQLRLDYTLRLAAGWLRLAETENCCAERNAESCILPLRGASVHRHPEGSTAARALLAEVLSAAPPDSPTALAARWLLNMTAMTLGQYPEGVPAAWRLPQSFFASDEPFPRFANIAGKLGLDSLNLAGSVVADDFDRDGTCDLLVTNYSADGQTQLYGNEGDGGFVNRTAAAGLTGLLGGLNAIQGDYDGDGFVDVLILRGAWLGKAGCHPRSLLHNDGNGRFTDRAFEAGLGGAYYPSMTAVWSDYDNDGDLDLYVGNEAGRDFPAPCQLFQNKGDGTFVDVAEAAGVTNGRFTKTVLAGDFDGDRWPDFYVSNLYDENRLYRNKRDGTFEDVAPALGLMGPRISYTGWFFDFDNDGALDILVHPFQAKPADLAAAALGLPFASELPSLYRNDGHGAFAEIGRASGLTQPYSAMGCNLGDLDNDGFLDFMVGTGRPQARDLVPNKVYRNLRGTGFADVTVASGMGHLQKGHGIAMADFDSDGDLDVFAQMGGAYSADNFANTFFENPGFGNHWLAVRLEGRRSNRSALGARIRADIVENGVMRSVYRTVSSGGSFGANPLRQHLGLGQAQKLERLEVFWPTTGETQTFRDVPLDRCLEITEGAEHPVVHECRPVRLGAAR